jgi:hypothetical protein
MNTLIVFALGATSMLALAILLVFLIPGKAVKFAVKLGGKLEKKLGAEKIAVLRGLAEKL